MMDYRLSRVWRHRRGFTLIEIILVVSIMMVLVSLASARWVGMMGKSNIKMTRIEMASIKTALGQFEVNTGELPTTAQGLRALIECPGNLPAAKWVKCMDKYPFDAWGREFKYACPGENGRDYDLISAGKDGRFGTADDLVCDEEETAKKN